MVNIKVQMQTYSGKYQLRTPGHLQLVQTGNNPFRHVQV